MKYCSNLGLLGGSRLRAYLSADDDSSPLCETQLLIPIVIMVTSTLSPETTTKLKNWGFSCPRSASTVRLLFQTLKSRRLRFLPYCTKMGGRKIEWRVQRST
jgi:hypothetical protein